MKNTLLLISVLFISIVMVSCNAKKSKEDIIETRTGLTSVEIINYIPKSSNSISLGFTKETQIKINSDTYSKMDEEYSSAKISNNNLYIDSIEFDVIKRIGDFNFLNQKQLASLIEMNHTVSLDSHTDLPAAILIGVITEHENNIIATLEIPIDKSLNWSIAKIWSYDPINHIPQIKSILITKSNLFDYIDINDRNLILGDDNFMYRVVLDDNYRFDKDMEVFVSMDVLNLIEE